MIDDESSVDPKSVADEAHFDEALLYDFAKFMTTLALLALGGMLTLIQTAGTHVAKKPVLAFVGGSIALAGICAVNAAMKLAKVGAPRRKGLSAQTLLLVGVGLLGMGTGGFLFLWWKTI